MSDAEQAIVARDLTKTFTVARKHEGRFAGLRSLFDPMLEKRTVVDRLSMSVSRVRTVNARESDSTTSATFYCVQRIAGPPRQVSMTRSRSRAWSRMR